MSDPIESPSPPAITPTITPALSSPLSPTRSAAADPNESDALAQQTLPYATAKTPMLSTPFPSPKLTAWVMLTFSMLSTVGGTLGLMWLAGTIMDSDQPIGAFACVPVPVLLLLAMIAGLIRETYHSFRRAYGRT